MIRWLLYCILATPLAAYAKPAGYEIGVEREHYPGHYSTLVGVVDGWQLWHLEYTSIADGEVVSTCKAIKTEEGAEAPKPVSAAIFDDPVIYAWMLWLGHREEVISVVGSPVNNPTVTEWRAEGERFFRQHDTFEDKWPSLDGQAVELHIIGKTWSDSFYDEFATIDMTGAAAARKWLEDCGRNGPSAP